MHQTNKFHLNHEKQTKIKWIFYDTCVSSTILDLVHNFFLFYIELKAKRKKLLFEICHAANATMTVNLFIHDENHGGAFEMLITFIRLHACIVSNISIFFCNLNGLYFSYKRNRAHQRLINITSTVKASTYTHVMIM